MGGGNFGLSVTGEKPRQPKCTNALIAGDMSNYWFPRLSFQDPPNSILEPVPMFYMNVYYLYA